MSRVLAVSLTLLLMLSLFAPAAGAVDDGTGGGTEDVVEDAQGRGNGNGNAGGNGNAANAPGNAPGQTGDAPGNAGNAPGQTGDAPGNAANAPGQTGERPGCNGVGNPECTGNANSSREAPIVYDDTDGLSEGEQWTRETPDTELDDLADTIGLDWNASSFAAAAPVGVAVIDTGVAGVPGLDHVVHGPDLSFDSQAENLTHLDGYGHGTHMAGIIGGRGIEGETGTELVGIAPDVDLYSLKVGSHSGAVDVTQVIAAVDWVAQHADELGIRVLNLAYGTDSVQPWDVDPLAYAVENAWRAGVVTVVSGGNDGESRDALRNPAINPWVLAVGASDSNGTPAVADDLLAPFSNRGTDERRVDVLAPGTGVISYRVEGSVLDEAYPEARRGEAGFSGSGSSQAAAVVSGVVANLLQDHPSATPDQVKAALVSTAQPIADGDPAAGAGVVNLTAARRALSTSLTLQDHPEGQATGSLDAARGTMRLADGPGHFSRNPAEILLQGEVDIHGQPFDVATWAASSAAGQAWVDGTWNGVEWTGSGFEDDVWQGRSWLNDSWSGRSWLGRSWLGRSWLGRSWLGGSWADEGTQFLSAGWLSLNPW